MGRIFSVGLYLLVGLVGYDLAEEYGCRVSGTDLEGSFGPVGICCPLGHDAQDPCLDN